VFDDFIRASFIKQDGPEGVDGTLRIASQMMVGNAAECESAAPVLHGASRFLILIQCAERPERYAPFPCNPIIPYVGSYTRRNMGR
jgi:hypothetical protein